jgi:hypothetical protein
MRQGRYSPRKVVRKTTYFSPEHGEDRDGVLIDRNGNFVEPEDGTSGQRQWHPLWDMTKGAS